MTQELYLTPEHIDNFEIFLRERESAPATVRKYLADIRTFCRYLGGDRRLSKQRILAYKEWLLCSGYAVSSANSMLAALNQYLDFAGLAALKVRRYKVQKNLFLTEEKELTPEEYRRLIRAAREEGRAQLALCMETIAATGIRISELSAFTVEAVKKNRILITNKGKYRRIFLPKELRRRLLFHARIRGLDKGLIFVTKNGRPKTRSNIWREMKSLKEKSRRLRRKDLPPQPAPPLRKNVLRHDQRPGRPGRPVRPQHPERHPHLHLQHRQDPSGTAGPAPKAQIRLKIARSGKKRAHSISYVLNLCSGRKKWNQ